MARGLILVKAGYDADAAVWFVESCDLEGVNAEAPSLEELLQKLAAWPALRTGDDLRDGITMANVSSALANLYRRLGRPGDASALDARSGELLKVWQNRLPTNAVLPANRQQSEITE